MDKWFSKRFNEFDNGSYLDDLFLGNSPYALKKRTEEPIDNERAAHLISIFRNVKNTPLSVLDAIVSCYATLGNGSPFGDHLRVVRTFERCWEANKTNKLESNLKLTTEIFNIIQELASLSVEDFIERVPPTDFLKQQGSKDKVFLQNSLLSKGYIDCAGAYTKLNKESKAFLSKDLTKVLGKIGINTNKSPDLVAKYNDTIYVAEGKYQVETGGAQNLSIGDGTDIFSIVNNSRYRIRRIFYFDGRLDLMLNHLSFITEENKIMSIFDVVEYIESGE